MYAATKKATNSNRVVGIGMVVVINGVLGYILANGLGSHMIAEITKTEVVVIEEQVQIEEEPPPPPPPQVDLPPPPPQVILPEFTFDVPPPPTAIQQVQQVAQPARPAEVRPPPPPPATPSKRPEINIRRFQEFLAEYYPPISRRNKEEGTVSVSMCVDASGRISNVQLTRSSGFPRLDDATVKGLPRQRLTPAKDSAGKNVDWCNPPFPLDVVWRLE